MAHPSRSLSLDYGVLAEFLSALDYPLRLELLDVLRFPHTLGEIRLRPHRREGGKSVERPVSRQTIQGHLDQLIDVNLLSVDRVEQGGRSVPRYVVNATKLYEITEQLRGLSVRYAGRGAGAEATGTMAALPRGEAVVGPRLVLVHGVYEGKAFPLDDDSARDGRWTLGRRRDAAISLDYDPFVSLDNATVTREGKRFIVTDLGSKNGTALNWAPLGKGASRPLKAGDVIGVGRSLLSFVPE